MYNFCLLYYFWSSLLVAGSYDSNSEVGLFPSLFNLAETANIFSNATCGIIHPEIYCKLASVYEDDSKRICGICDENQIDKSHSIEFAIDGKDTYWMSSSLQLGSSSQFVTITIDLKNIFQVAYILIKSGISPRPGTWILEKSLDGDEWFPWQFFAENDESCWHTFGVEPRKDKPTYSGDSEVICTSYYSKLEPLENGKIHVSLVNGRPGANGPSRSLLDFTKARYIRFRLLKMQLFRNDAILIDSKLDVLRQYFYSIQDITIGGQCPCNGHASECPLNPRTMSYSCTCKHNTCGEHCNTCCSLYNQKRWRPGKFISGNECERCQCFGHANECIFDPTVEAERRSLNTNGKYEGGGVCLNCRDETFGVNCELCREGFFRPKGVSRFDPSPCTPCKCEQIHGSNGSCYPNESLSGKQAGDCVCKTGYEGPRCQKCSLGFHGFPDCSPCPCNYAGTLNGTCSGVCDCKAHVTGLSCHLCKPGYFSLSSTHSEGCLKCFCYGVSNECEGADLGVEVLNERENWKVTDLRRQIIVSPYWSAINNGVTIAEEEIEGLESYFWEAPPLYLGNRLLSYGQKLRLTTSWHTARGDTAGSSLVGPDVLLEGSGMMIAYGTARYRGNTNASITVNWTEDGWYHIPKTIQTIRQPIEDIPEFVGKEVNKIEFMMILGTLTRMLIRSKYHTDQLEGTLHTAEMEFGSLKSFNLNVRTTSVEQCICPLGYEGLSCETCTYGYTRVNKTLYRGICEPCNCNGHAASCDSYTLQCGTCQHNTRGSNCEQCIDGYYGNPLHKTPSDCKPCKCPLDVLSNNFSPTCEVATQDFDKYFLGSQEYICTGCPRGFAGTKCERCANGYYGNPLMIGDTCKPCECHGNANLYSDNWCDRTTGECLVCLGNTGGWNCDKCLKGFYGNAYAGQCLPCNCNVHGSLDGNCDSRSGQCTCKDSKISGRTCSQCKNGYGNLKAGCRKCECHSLGSLDDGCDAESGQCNCKSGVTGLICNECNVLSYGFSEKGCQSCNCHPGGSSSLSCDSLTGQCTCHPFVSHRRCDVCVSGYWNISSGQGCSKCLCDPMGSLHGNCNDDNGQCVCKNGVGGRVCDSCLAGYWSFSSSGCKKCSPCQKAGHICDPDTGRCICPPLTLGEHCEKCESGTWNYDSIKGCQICKCHSHGSVSSDCHMNTGHCKCLRGFEGEKCDRCSYGYYNFPYCRPCNCHFEGTEKTECSKDKLCNCTSDGTCKCKSNVEGRKCASCKRESFGLTENNPLGCVKCFCFSRGVTCREGNFSWSQISFSEGRKLTIGRGKGSFLTSNDYIIIPNERGDVSMGVKALSQEPLYWSLPSVLFHRDLLSSYNGYLRFSISENGWKVFPSLSESFPLLQIIGHDEICLENYQRKVSSSGRYEVRLNEKYWVSCGSKTRVSRELLMTALQRVSRIIIRGTDRLESTLLHLHGVSLDVARETKESKSLATGIEVCDCPEKYTGTSCQNPGEGYFRILHQKSNSNSNTLNFVGDVKKCECNGRATNCHSETGACFNCTDNTMGHHCNLCSLGFYGSPSTGTPCKPCLCPDEKRNFAETCSVNPYNEFSCQCRPGYSGPKCDRCDYGYYGNPKNSVCLPCHCNPYGSLTDQCDVTNGQCYCGVGIRGRDCSSCSSSQTVLTSARVCKNCDSNCISSLLHVIQEFLVSKLGNTSFDLSTSTAPRAKLSHFQRKNKDLSFELKELDNMNFQLHKMFIALQKQIPNFKIFLLESEECVKRARSLTSQSLIETARSLEIQMAYNTEELHVVLRRIHEFLFLQKSSFETFEPFDLEAESILSRLQKMSLREEDIMARLEYSRSRALKKRIIKNFFGSSLKEIRQRIEVLEDNLNTLIFPIEESTIKTQKALGQIQKQKTDLQTILEKYTEIHPNHTMLKGLEIQKIISESDRALVVAANHFVQLNSSFSLTVKREKALKLNENQSEGLENMKQRLLLPCLQLRAGTLEKYKLSQSVFKSLLRNKTRNIISAIESFKLISSQVTQAQKYSLSASSDADKALSKIISLRESLNETDRIRLKSEDLHQEASGLQNNAYSLKAQYISLLSEIESQEKRVNYQIKTLYSLSESKTQFNDFLLPSKFSSSSSSSSSLLSQKSWNENLTLTLKEFNEVVEDIGRKSKSKFVSLQNVSLYNLSYIPKQISSSYKIHSRILKESLYLERRMSQTEGLFETYKEESNKLRQRILLANQAASSIGLSLSSESSTSSCHRTYAVDLRHCLSNSIRFTFGLRSHDESNGLLLFLGHSQEFMALEMVNRQIRFIWNNGHGSAFITHNVSIDVSSKTQEIIWYKISVERIGHIGRLNVRKVNPHFDIPDYHKWVVGETPIEGNVLELHLEDLLHIGGLPSSMTSSFLTSTQMTGTLVNLFLNDESIGLWNFVESNNCVVGSSSVSYWEETEESSCLTFNGQGYASHSNIINYDSRYLSISFEFKSYDENALLFFAVNSLKSQYLGLEIKFGYLHFTLYYGPDQMLEFTSSKPYNNGSWVKVEMARASRQGNETGVLRLHHNGIQEEHFRSLSVSENQWDFIMEDCLMFFGGVSPTFNRSQFPSFKFNSFLGSLRGITISNPGSNGLIHPLYTNIEQKKSYYGVRPVCDNQILTVVSFKGSGFLQTRSQPLRRDFNIGLSFQTFKSEGVLLLSTYSDSFSADDAIESYYSVSMTSGRLSFLFKGTRSREAIVAYTPLTYNDNQFHTVFIIKINKRIKIYVDDILSISGFDLDSDENFASLNSELFIGGLPSQYFSSSMVTSSSSWFGTIKDIIFIDKLSIRMVSLNDPIRYSESFIGRSLKAEDTERKIVCDIRQEPFSSFHLSVIPGDDTRSLYLPLIEFSSLAFSVKTSTYDEGLLFMMLSEQKKKKSKYFAGYFFKNNLEFVLVGKKRHGLKIPLINNNNENENKWREIQILVSNRNELTVLYDGVEKGFLEFSGRIPIGNKIVFGKIPSEFVPSIHQEAPLLTPFVGCLRNILLNGDSSFPSNKGYHPCLENKEHGIYFYELGFVQWNLSVHEIEFSFKSSSSSTNQMIASLETRTEYRLSLHYEHGHLILKHGGSWNEILDSSYCTNGWNFISFSLKKKDESLTVQYNEKTFKVNQPEGQTFESLSFGRQNSEKGFEGCIRSLRSFPPFSFISRQNDSSLLDAQSCPFP